MNLLNTLSQPTARMALIVYGAGVSATALGAFVAGGGFGNSVIGGLPPATLLAGAIITGIAGGGAVMARLLHRAAVWDRRLAALADQGELDPLTLPVASGDTAADIGWNRLLDQGRRWQAVAELEQSLSEKLCEGESGAALSLLDALADGVVAVDASGVITRANAMMAAICCVDSADQLRGKRLSDLLNTDASPQVGADEPSSSPRDVVEWTLPPGTGSPRTLRGTRRSVRDGDGQTGMFVWTVRDVTQQRLAESMREQFLTAATHEFRTPLANIRAYAESLDMGHDIDAEARKRFYNVIQSESLRLSQLVDDLLDISRMQAGALALESRETELGRLVEEVAAKVQGQIREKNQQLRCELPPRFPKVAVDKTKLSAALVNLLGNAAKYTPDGGQVTFRVDVGAQQVQFSVTDTGIGIADEELPHVFERFYRSNDDRVREVNGSGLGLALSQEIARLHGGEITVESALNQGSTFRMNIPLDTAV